MLHAARLPEQNDVMFLAEPQRPLRAFSLDNLRLQAPVAGDELIAAQLKRLVCLLQLRDVLDRRATRRFDRGKYVEEERPRPFHRPLAHGFRAIGGHEGEERLPMDIGQIESAQTVQDRLSSQSVRRSRGRTQSIAQMAAQCSMIRPRQPGWLLF